MVERNDDFTHEAETEAPQNPPNSVLRPEVRTAAWWLYVAPLIIICAVVGVAMMYWAGGRGSTPGQLDDVAATTGVDATPGGRSADRVPGSTGDELRYRGAGERSGGALSPLVAGQNVRLENMRVAKVDANMIWVEYGGTTIAVTAAPDDTRDLREGMLVDVTGQVERDSANNARIRATRIQTR